MDYCIKCGEKSEYFLDKEGSFSCGSCLTDEKKKGAIKLEKYYILDKEIDYLRLNKISFTFFGFKHITSYLIQYLEKLKEIATQNSFGVILFPDKESSNNFSKEIFGRHSGTEGIETRYSFIVLDGEYFLLLNYNKIKLEELGFLIKYFDSKIKYKLDQEILEKCLEVYGNILFRYNKKIGIDFINFLGNEEKSLLFADMLVHAVLDYHSLKDLSADYPTATEEYMLTHIIDYGSKALDMVTEGLPAFDAFIDLTLKFTHWSIFEFIDNNSNGKVTKEFNSMLKNSNWGEYNQVKDLLLNYSEALKEELSKNSNYIETIALINNLINKIIDSVQPIFTRFDEIFVVLEEGRHLAAELQILGPKSKLNPEEYLDYIQKTKQIFEKVQNPAIKFFLDEGRWHLLSEYAIINQDKDMYKRAVDQRNDSIDYFLKNKEKIAKAIPWYDIRKEDLVLKYNSLCYLSYCFGDMKTYNKVKSKINEFIEDPEISTFIKIMILSQNFFENEDYHSLHEILKLYKSFNSEDFLSNRENTIRSIGYFSEAFYSKDITIKGDLYSKAISANINDEIEISALQKNLTQMEVMDRFLKMFFHLESALNNPSAFFMIQEIKDALEQAKKNKEKSKNFESKCYFFYKTQIIYSLLKNDYEEVISNLEKIKTFEFKSSNKFQTFVKNYIKIDDSEINEKLHYLVNLKPTEDVWINVIVKFLRESVNRDYFKEFSTIKNDLKSLKDMDSLMTRFKAFVLDSAVTGFWNKRRTDLTSNPEEVGRSLLLFFLRMLERYDLHKEAEVNFYKMDIIAINNSNKNEAIIFETKIYRSKSNYQKGIKQIREKYVKYKKDIYSKLDAYYVVFDDKNVEELPQYIDGDGIRIKIVQIPLK